MVLKIYAYLVILAVLNVVELPLPAQFVILITFCFRGLVGWIARRQATSPTLLPGNVSYVLSFVLV